MKTLTRLALAALATLTALPATAALYRVEAEGAACSFMVCPHSTLAFNYDSVTGTFSDLEWDIRYYDSRGWVFQHVMTTSDPFSVDELTSGNDGYILEALQSFSLNFDYAFTGTASGYTSTGNSSSTPIYYQTGVSSKPYSPLLDWTPTTTLDDGVGTLGFYVRDRRSGATGLGTYHGFGAVATATELTTAPVPLPAGGVLLAAGLAGLGFARRARRG